MRGGGRNFLCREPGCAKALGANIQCGISEDVNRGTLDADAKSNLERRLFFDACEKLNLAFPGGLGSGDDNGSPSCELASEL